jgi:alpha-L-fucosidase
MFSFVPLTPPATRCLAAGLVMVLFAACPLRSQVSRSPTAPTSSEDPAVTDQVWQKASAKYDGPRNSILQEVDRVGHQGPFRPDWESLEKYEAPEWYQDAKFGIFIHWGVYSVPCFGNEWYPRNMYRQDSDEYRHHLAT